ncbi:MAG: thiolase domain-containing protein [Anaerolineae bacterium]|nr:thiolase domain-containing protein [Anaerolineae bacterium]
MRDVSIIGVGQTKVGEHWDRGLADLAVEATLAGLDDAGLDNADILYVGNMLGGVLSGQEHLGALIADLAGLRGMPALRVEAADASGGVALHQAYQAVAGGMVDTALVVGVEKMTDRLPQATEEGLMLAGLGDYEAAQGVTYVSQTAMLMQRYLHEHSLEVGDFAQFPVNAHRNAAANPFAMYRNQISEKAYRQAKMIASPINLLDGAPWADGAAAVVLVPTEQAQAMGRQGIRILASTLVTDALSLTERDDPLALAAARASAQRAYQQAGLTPGDIHLAELHDAFSILAALTLEACGFAARGQGVKLGQAGDIARAGRIPIATLGGFKARGNPVGASGVYQAVEIVQQLRGAAGQSQIPAARVGLAQNLGGNGATAVTHIFMN